ncbi:MAG: hypothetical protein M1314_00480, partial [Firmicutes bacterium]|nr:hypothetical protein [Bacillota bacterium]
TRAYAIFGSGGFVVEVADAAAFDRACAGTPFVSAIGTTIAQPAIAIGAERFDLAPLHEAWRRPLAEVYP